MTVVRSQWSVVGKSVFLFALTAVLFALCFSAEAQQSKKVLRIRYLTANTSSAELPRLDAFRQGLRCSAPSERR